MEAVEAAAAVYRRNRLLSAGLGEKLIDSMMVNSKTVDTFLVVLDEAHILPSMTYTKMVGILLADVATKLPIETSTVVKTNRHILSEYIRDGKIKSQAQLGGALNYLKRADSFDLVTFEKAAGVGVLFTTGEIAGVVSEIMDKHTISLADKRYSLQSKMYALCNEALKFADGKAVKDEVDKQIGARLGPRTESDSKRKPATTAPTSTSISTATATSTETSTAEVKIKPRIAAVMSATGEDEFEKTSRSIPAARNTEVQLSAHLAATNGQIRTRFPPEPNGVLHLGHAKAARLNFGVAQENKGVCIMRLDDTNPEAEKKDYIDKILENVQSLGHKWSAVTYSSDYFPQLYQFAVKLIERGLAYVDHQTAAEIEQCRSIHKESPWRNRSVEDNLRLFDEMKRGKSYLASQGRYGTFKPTNVGHCRLSNQLCTLEFEIRRESYFWLLDVLDLYKPKVWEYSRLNVDYNVMSKRRLMELVEAKHVSGWDDPRLLTIDGLWRRGYTPAAIDSFCAQCGVSRNQNSIPYERLEQAARDDLDNKASRAMVILHPIKVVLTNWPPCNNTDKDKKEGKDEQVEMCKAPLYPRNTDRGSRSIPLSRVVYIEAADFRTDASDPSYFGLAPGREVHLKYAYNIRCTGVRFKGNGHQIAEIEAEVDFTSGYNTTNDNNNDDNEAKINARGHAKTHGMAKGKLSWVSEPSPGVEPLTVECRLYSPLFMSAQPPKDYVANLNPYSLVVVKKAYAEPCLATAEHADKFQFERIGYFNTDPDTTASTKVFNLTVPLKIGSNLKKSASGTPSAVVVVVQK